MQNPLEIITKYLRDSGLKYSIEDYEDEKVVIVELGEDFGVYISVLCRGNNCDVEYAIGDENFTIRPEKIGLLGKAVEVITQVNSRLKEQG